MDNGIKKIAITSAIFSAALLLTMTTSQIVYATSLQWTAGITTPAGNEGLVATDLTHSANYVIRKSNLGYLAATYNGGLRVDFMTLPNPPEFQDIDFSFAGETIYKATYFVGSNGQIGCSFAQWNKLMNCYKHEVRQDFVDGTGAKYKPTLREFGTLFDGVAGYPKYESHYRVDIDLPSSGSGDYIKKKDSNCGTTWTEISYETTSATLCSGQAWRVLDYSVAPPAVSPSLGFDPTGTTSLIPVKYKSTELDPTYYPQDAAGYANNEPIGRADNIDLVVWLDIEEQAASGHCMPGVGAACNIYGAWITNSL